MKLELDRLDHFVLTVKDIEAASEAVKRVYRAGFVQQKADETAESSGIARNRPQISETATPNPQTRTKRKQGAPSLGWRSLRV